LNLSILTVVASARNFREMRSDDRFEPIPVNCHCANLCPQLANAFRTRTEQERALRVAFGTFTKPSTNARSLRIPAGWSRRQADVAVRGGGCRIWAESRPTGVAQGTAGIGRRPGIRRYAVSPHFRCLPNRRCQRRPRPLCRIGNHPPHMADNRKDHLVAISLRTIAAAAGPSAPRQPQPAGAGCAPDASTRESTLSVIATAAPMRAHAARIKRPTVKPPVRSLK
jgi:hypothetical protein